MCYNGYMENKKLLHAYIRTLRRNGATPKEISKEFGISTRRIRQIVYEGEDDDINDEEIIGNKELPCSFCEKSLVGVRIIELESRVYGLACKLCRGVIKKHSRIIVNYASIVNRKNI